MREILTELEAGPQLSDPDPVRRAQILSKMPLPKRFYTAAGVGAGEGGFTVLLDGRPVRTPGRAILALPTEAAAHLVADEFAAQAELIDPAKMPVTRLANSAFDGVANHGASVIAEIVNFAGTDLVCYRAEAPEGLVAMQSAAWDPVLDWAKTALGARFHLAAGVLHIEQPQPSIAAVERHVAARGEPFRLAAIHVMTTLTGSALIALAVESRALDAEAAWSAAHVDEDWTNGFWGEDAEAMQRRAFRKADMDGAVRLLSALDP